MTLALWLLVYLLITYGVGKLYESTIGWRGAMYAFYPAVLVTALGRLLATLLSNQKIGQVDLLRTGGPSRGGSDKLPGGWWFRFLYAILPFACSVAAFVFVWDLLDEPMDFGRRLPGLSLDSAVFDHSLSTLGSFLSEFVRSFGHQRLGNVNMWLFLYAGFGLVVAASPSRDDLISVGAVCAGAGVLVFLLGKAGVQVVASGVYGGVFWRGFSLQVAMSLFVILATLVVLLPVKYIRAPKDK